VEATTLETAKGAVESYLAALRRGDGEAVARCFAPDARIWMVLGWGRPADLRETWSTPTALEVREMIEEDGSVAVRFAGGATEWFKVEGGRIRRHWGARAASALFARL